jgi:hypothetical protein
LWDGFINFFVFLSEEGVFLLLGQEFEKCFIRWQQDPWTAIVQVAPANDVRASNWTSSMIMIALIVTNHSNHNCSRIVRESQFALDTRNATRESDIKNRSLLVHRSNPADRYGPARAINHNAVRI